jgi:hypothetical protein
VKDSGAKLGPLEEKSKRLEGKNEGVGRKRIVKKT